MPQRRHQAISSSVVQDFRHAEARRKNNPPAGIALTYEVCERQQTRYEYDPHLDPQLVWAGKMEHTSFNVDVVPLHIHERVSTRAILDAVRRSGPLQLSLFGETPLPADQQIEFYRHEVGWVNRLILGDSLLVMNSLLVKEGMAGKVQMIYIDPPYGIRYASNFQPRIDRSDVKDQDNDLTHEPEQIKAYRDRLLLARELLSESGSIFVQINDENLHLVRCLLDEVFGRENFVAVVVFRKTGYQASQLIPSVNDHLLWYAENKVKVKYRPLVIPKAQSQRGLVDYRWIELPTGDRYRLDKERDTDVAELRSAGCQLFQDTSLVSQGETQGGTFQFEFCNKRFHPAANNHWKTSILGLQRLRQADRLIVSGDTLRFIHYMSDFDVSTLTNIWDDTMGERKKIYAVQTNTKVIERCILMTTDPGDLVLDPTCGSGTTAYCAEKWGRRWIACDTSRVALAIARQRLMTAKFDYYELWDAERGPAGGFFYETIPHITLESIAKNTEIDEIANRYQPHIDQALVEMNDALRTDWKEWEVPCEVPHPVWPKEAQQAFRCLHELKDRETPVATEEQVGVLLEKIYRLTGHRWKCLKEVPEPVPAFNWPQPAQAALRRFWELKRRKRDEIDKSIQRNAPQETLYDRPRIKRGVVRVSGPFTVEAIPVPAVEDPTQAPIPRFEEQGAWERIADYGGDHLATMLNLLRQQGNILFPDGKKMELANLRMLNLGYLHAEAEDIQNGKTVRVAISFGPRYGPVTATQASEAIQTAKLNAYGVLILAGFSIEAEAQAFVQKTPVKGLSIHFANISPDVLVGDLLKTTRASQIFTVFGQPDVRVSSQKDGTFVVELQGVDIYDPSTGEVRPTRGKDVAAWFLDTDYDGNTFHICQAFFPGDADAWDKLQRALKAQIDPEAFNQMRDIASFPFKRGEHQRIAVKVIDFRGNEVVRVVKL